MFDTEHNDDQFQTLSEEIGIPYQHLMNLYLQDCAASHRKLQLEWRWEDGRIRIQHSGTEDHIAEKLVKRGVPKEDIVLGFQPPYTRKHTGYGVS